MPYRPPVPTRGSRLYDGLRIGLLGGSFNPAHRGHRHISRLALARFDLDFVWWLVSPQNPLKPRAGMAPFDDRMASAQAMADGPHMVPTDIEARLETRFTADTLIALTRRFPRTRFVWIMGADNLRQIDRWDRWRDIFATTPVAVFDRPPYSLTALAGRAARTYRRHRLVGPAMRRLARVGPPAWAFVPCVLDPTSATAIRAARGGSGQIREDQRFP